MRGGEGVFVMAMSAAVKHVTSTYAACTGPCHMFLSMSLCRGAVCVPSGLSRTFITFMSFRPVSSLCFVSSSRSSSVLSHRSVPSRIIVPSRLDTFGDTLRSIREAGRGRYSIIHMRNGFKQFRMVFQSGVDMVEDVFLPRLSIYHETSNLGVFSIFRYAY